MLLIDDRPALINGTHLIASMTLRRDGSVACVVCDRSNRCSDVAIRLPVREAEALWADATNVVAHVPWTTAREDYGRRGRLMICLEDGIAWGRQLRPRDDWAMTLADRFRSSVAKQWIRIGDPSVSLQRETSTPRDSIVALHDDGLMKINNGIPLRDVTIRGDGMVMAGFDTGNALHEHICLTAQLPANERDAVWNVATNLVACVSSDPPGAGWSGPCFGVSVRMGPADQPGALADGPPDRGWTKVSGRPDILYGAELKDAVIAFRAVVSNAFDRVPPIDRRRMSGFAGKQGWPAAAAMTPPDAPPSDLSIEDTEREGEPDPVPSRESRAREALADMMFSTLHLVLAAQDDSDRSDYLARPGDEISEAVIDYFGQAGLSGFCDMKRHCVVDPWGQPLFFGMAGGRYFVLSGGPDGKWETTEDNFRGGLIPAPVQALLRTKAEAQDTENTGDRSALQ